jgi:hypothetical protein
MQEVFVQRKHNRFEPISQGDEDKIKDFPTDQVLRLQVSGVQNPRSLIQLNMYFATCQSVADNTEDKDWNSKEKVDFQCRIATNFVNTQESVWDGHRMHFKYRSIAFKNLKHIEACDYFNRAWEIMAAKIGVTVEKLLENSKP